MSDQPSTNSEFAYHELPRKAFPFTVEILRSDTDEVVYSETVEAPETIVSVHVPPLAHQLGVPVWVRITYGDGKVIESKEFIDGDEATSV